MRDRPLNMVRAFVLIAEDNRDTREMYAMYLSMVGYAVETAADGREALVKAVTLRPTVIVMDLQMPGVDGWRALREIRGDPKTATIPVIVLTGHDFKQYLRHSAMAEGATVFLTKPCLPDQLALEIGKHLGGSHRRTAHAL